MASWQDIKEMLAFIKEDSSAPRSLKEKINNMTTFIDSDKDTQLKINQLQQELEDISNDVNLPAFVRTQVWSVSGALETVDE